DGCISLISSYPLILSFSHQLLFSLPLSYPHRGYCGNREVSQEVNSKGFFTRLHPIKNRTGRTRNIIPR
ncbi:hypothetical protein DPEC_G00240240, partial [Dallia pectoralis]